MPEEQQQNSKNPGFAKTVTKRALAPVVATAATAATGYAIRKGTEIWEQRLRPKVEERGGARELARDTLGHATGTLGGAVQRSAVSDKVSSLANRVSAGDGADAPSPAQEPSMNDAERKAERKRREQRRQERRQALEQAKSS